jgi:non-specific serine/threonine protein kinase
MEKERERAFSALLKALRSAAGLTHQELAARACLSVRGISDLERGLILRPRPETVRLLADALQLTPSERSHLEAAARRHRSPPVGREDAPSTLRLAGAAEGRGHVGVPHNLPAELTSFVGHAAELTALATRLHAADGARLITLTGAGGCGKTRLALRVARHVGDAFPDGVWFVDLAALREPTLVPTSIAAALGLVESGRHPAAAVLRLALRQRTLLLILDNCEPLIDAVAEVADALLRTCLRLRILATSREPLRVPGEIAWRVRPLSVPRPPHPVSDAGRGGTLGLTAGTTAGAGERLDIAGDRPPSTTVSPAGHASEQSVEEVLASEAGRLFVERATAVAPAFQLTAETAPAIAQLCQRLDGLPLAIELAAARLPLLSVAQLATRLEDCLGLLTGGSRTAPQRHQSLRALLDGSYELLAPLERAVLGRLAVFAGGWTLEAAEAVGGAPTTGVDAPGAAQGTEGEARPPVSGRTLDVLGRLVDLSLVVAEESDGTRRYRLPETVRQYAEERLQASGELAEVHDRHRDWYLAVSEAASRELNGPRHGAWMRRLAADHDNLRAALVWCRESADGPALGLRLAANLGWYFLSAHRFGEGCHWLATFLALVPRRDAVRARALEAAARIHLHDGDLPAARARGEELLAVAQDIGDARVVGEADVRMALIEASEGAYPAAWVRLQRCASAARARGDSAACWECTLNLGLVAIAAGNDAEARPLLDEALRLAQRTGIAGYAAMVLLRLSILDRLSGDFTRARREIAACRAIFRDAWVTEDHTLTCLGNLARAQGQLAQAHVLLAEAVRQGERRGDRRAVAEKVGWCGVLAVAAGNAVRGVRLMAAARAENPGLASIHVPDARREVEASLARARTCLGEAAFSQAWAAGQTMALEQAVADALDGENL